MNNPTRRPIRIANCSGFFGDRLSAAKEMVNGGPIDVLTGDWLAELTMLILARQRMKHGEGSGYARTFLTQANDVLATCLERDIKIVTNAGGLDPQGLADALRTQAQEAGLTPKIAIVTGDDVTGRVEELSAQGEIFENLDTGVALAESGVTPLTASVYIGGSGITAALAAGADVVITGRCTDAALVIGPAAWWHGWDYADSATLDSLAGALVAGHVIECGAQACGGNYAFFGDLAQRDNIGFPIAEVASNGDSVITKHPGTGGMVSVGTVTAQLLYEVGAPEYRNPDVTADFSSFSLAQVGRDRVRISGTVGIAPPDRLKISMNYLGGFRNSMTLVLTGLDIEDKASWALESIAGLTLDDVGAPAPALAAKSTLAVSELAVDFVRGDRPDPSSSAAGQAHLRITVKDPNPKAVGKAFTAPAVESALASYPGMFPTLPPGNGSPYGVYWPTTVAAEAITVLVTLDGESVAELPGGSPQAQGHASYDRNLAPTGAAANNADPTDPSQVVPLGQLVGARSGDKGGNANVGVWVPDPTESEAVALAGGLTDALVTRVITSAEETAQLWETDWPLPADPERVILADQTYAWLRDLLATSTAVQALLPDAQDLVVDIYELPNLRAVNIVIHGLLGRGVAENTSLDPQAKGLGELLRARLVSAPITLLGDESE
ncbi:MAG: DUF1446 domain-containing protein [Actinomycetia bacterium]|nr:DUF1446 domain-containing protein [Actinomycetes bacterium]